MESDYRVLWDLSGGKSPTHWVFHSIESLLRDSKSISVGVMYPGRSNETGIPLIRVADVKDGRVVNKPDYLISDKVDEEYKRTRLDGSELLITLVGNPGDCVVVSDYMKGWNVARALAVVRLDDPSIREWLRYVLLSPPAMHQIDSRLNTTVQRTLNLKDIREIGVPLPPKKERDAITNALNTLDDKIELNRQMNQTLEAMAQALFKSWFVDFDPVIDNALAAGNAIPDEFAERAKQRKEIEKKDNADIQSLFPNEFEFTEEMGWIPKGWGNGTLSDICSFGKGKINTSELSLENYVSTENMNKEKAGISYAASIASTNQVPKFSVGQTLISNIRPYFKKIWLASFSGGRSNDVLGFQANDAVANEYLFSLLYQDSFFDYMTATSKGTKMPRGDKAAIMSWSVAIPSATLMDEFSRKVKPMYLANQTRSAQAISLSELRDTLLPKLMSGELRIPDVAVILEEC